MQTKLEKGENIPTFVVKLRIMVDDPKTDHIISWSPSGNTFVIRNSSEFTKLLPGYFKHQNLASFIRQLNMYDFHKRYELGGINNERNELEFFHKFFNKDNSELTKRIKRKQSSTKNQDPVYSSFAPEVTNKIFAEVTNMKNCQKNMRDTIIKMERRNSELEDEVARLKRKSSNHQKIISKLIQFLVTLVQPSRSGISVKRQYPLMINDSIRPHKRNKLSKSSEKFPTGPVIHELDESESDAKLDESESDAKHDESESDAKHDESESDAKLDESEADVNFDEPESDAILFVMCKDLNYVQHGVGLQTRNEKTRSPTVQSPNVQSPQEHIEETDDENMETACSFNAPIHVPEIKEEIKKKRTCKDKKKRKNQAPVKISTLDNEKIRTHLHMREGSTDEDEFATLMRNESISSKPIPMTIVHSPKLAAMAANIKSQDIDIDMNAPTALDDNIEALNNDDAFSIKLEDMRDRDMHYNAYKNMITNDAKDKDNSNGNKMNIERNPTDAGTSVLITNNNGTNNNEQWDENGIKSSQEDDNRYDNAVVRSSNDLLVSLINSSGKTDANYRLEPLEEVDQCLDANLPMFRSDYFGIDSNFLLDLYNGVDLPISPELNPGSNYVQKDDDHTNSVKGSVGGELVTYNPQVVSQFPPSNLFQSNNMHYESVSASNPSDVQINKNCTTKFTEDSFLNKYFV